MPYTPASFTPPHCPNPACRHHAEPRDWRWRRFGFYVRLASPQRIPRFRCDHCGRTFSTQTFSLTYWLRRPDLPLAVFYRLLACSGFRQMAREAGVAPSTVTRLASRLGRHCLLFGELHRPQGPVEEPIVVDGFESFEYSQYHPIHLNLAIGAQSHFLRAFTDSELRRKGRMTDAQRARREQLETSLGRPARGTLIRDVETLLRLAVREPQTLTVRSDQHPAYPPAFRRLVGWRVSHETTISTAPRTSRNPLFPANLADLLIRHGSANHKRETIAFSKRRQCAVERLAVFVVWRNFVKRFSERHGGPTPAMALGLQHRPLSPNELLDRRLFPFRVGLPDRLWSYYRREIQTRAISNGTRHCLTYAF